MPNGKTVHKATMVATLNANPTLDASRLTRVMEGRRNAVHEADGDADGDADDEDDENGANIGNNQEQEQEFDNNSVCLHGYVMWDREGEDGEEPTRHCGQVTRMVRTTRSHTTNKNIVTIYRNPVSISEGCTGLMLTCAPLKEGVTVNGFFARGRRARRIPPSHMEFDNTLPLSVTFDTVVQAVKVTRRDGGRPGFTLTAEDSATFITAPT
jgi:hypothetical protein